MEYQGCAGETIGASYQLEYGEDRIEVHTGAIKEGQNVLLIDDLIATGGTLAAGVKLVEQVGLVFDTLSSRNTMTGCHDIIPCRRLVRTLLAVAGACVHRAANAQPSCNAWPGIA